MLFYDYSVLLNGVYHSEYTREEYMQNLQDRTESLKNLIQNQNSNGELVSALRKIGRLPNNFNGDLFLSLLNNENNQVRLLAIKNIGKLCDIRYLYPLAKIALEDENSMLRREATSSIGRMRCTETIGTQKKILKDPDPKVILQAIRGLLVFKNREDVKDAIMELKSHPNEIIQSLIKTEFDCTKDSLEKCTNHTKSPDYLKNVSVKGDVRSVLDLVADNSVHLTFTSPPYYNARDYSIYQSYKQYLEFLQDVFKKVHRITKDGRFFILNTSPVIIPRVSRKHSSKRYSIPFDIHPYIIDMGWEFIDDIIWLKPEASAKNRNAGFLQHRKPLAYKANSVTEYLMVYRKKTNKLIDWNIKQYSEQIVEKSKVRGKYETSNIWQIDPVFDRVHSAVFPEELCKKVIMFYSYIGDLVFDPFAGSGTFGKTAMKMSRYFFQTEFCDKYFNRIKANIGELNLFRKKQKLPRFFDIEKFKDAIKE
jgi:DNA modification methylase